MSRRRKIVAIAFAALVAVGAVIGTVVELTSSSAKDNAALAGTLNVGHVAPDFTLPGVNGGTVALSAYRGQRVILTFGASYCHPCHEEFPLLAAAARRYKQVRVVGVDPADLPGDMRQTMQQTGATWPVGDDRQGDIAARYGVTVLPITFFVAPNGRIVARGFGITSQSALDEPLRTLLAT